jgi:hypothetical protein
MEMANYILRLLKAQLMIVWSWGFNSPIAITNGLKFKVQGFKFKGWVEVMYEEGKDLFKVTFIERNNVVHVVEDVFFDMLVEVIDNVVEKTENYTECVNSEYSLL